MERLTTVNSVRFWLRARRGGTGANPAVGFVPTLGALHEGHLALLHRAKSENDAVVASVFVNPTQFDDKADLAAYPRDLVRDATLAEKAGADVLFAPDAAEMYPAGFATQVLVGGPLTELLEGYFRPGHFAGVSTVVAKLLGIVGPDRAYFGEKDWQQLKVIEKMVAELNLPVQIVGCPTVREADGLALSSRNARLSFEGRQKARVLPYLLDTAQDLLDANTFETPTREGAVLRHWLLTLLESHQPTAQLDYIAVVDPDTLVDVDKISDRALVAIALRIDGVRLLDNRLITVR